MFPNNRPYTLRVRQRGVSLVFIMVGMTALLLTTALALDVGHATLNKSRLQNATDAAALAAAKILDSTAGNTVLASTEAFTAFGNNANSSGDQELATAYANNNGSISITIQYSATLPPFTPGSATGPFVRVIVKGFTRPSWFAQVGGISQIAVNASAVAGPSPSINNSCNLVPMMACGTPPPSPPATVPANWDYGYTVNAPAVMKFAANGSGAVGPGNFQLIDLPGGNGASWVEQNLAGGYNGCVGLGNNLTTEPGDETGPVAFGLDTRFGDYQGPMKGTSGQYPPDAITTQPSPALTVNTSASGCSSTAPCIASGSTILTAANIDSLVFDYDAYISEMQAQSFTVPAGSQIDRRILTVPVANCSGNTSGSKPIPIIGYACFFLLQEPTHQGNTDWVLGQYIGNCNTDGTPGSAPSVGSLPYIIQLYRDPDSGDS